MSTWQRIAFKSPGDGTTDVSDLNPLPIGSAAETGTKRAFANVAASATAAVVVAGVAGKSLRVTGLVAWCGALATTITFNSATTAISPLFANDVNDGPVLPHSPGGWLQTAPGEALTATTGVGSATGVLVTYQEI